jgi:short-subunit dehydrogenase
MGIAVAVVSGASSGIGRALAIELGKGGAKVALLARRANELEAVAKDVRAAGGEALPLPCDVTDGPTTAAAIARAASELGPIDLVVANAGIGVMGAAAKTRLDLQSKVVSVNLLGAIHVVHPALEGMLARGRGRIVFVSSLLAYGGLPGSAAYGATKAGVNAYARSLRRELVGTGVTVTTACPGFVKTPMIDGAGFPTPLAWSPERAARQILGAAKRGTSVTNFPRVAYWMMRLGSATPDWIVGKVLKKAY